MTPTAKTSVAEIAIEEAGAADPFSVPIQSIGAVRRTAENSRMEHRVQQGMIARRPDGKTTITDRTGSMSVRIDEMSSGLSDTAVDVSGLPAARERAAAPIGVGPGAYAVQAGVIYRTLDGTTWTRLAASPVEFPAQVGASSADIRAEHTIQVIGGGVTR